MKPPDVQVAPSLLAADFSRLAKEIHRVEEAGADMLHLDIMDGHFVPNLSFGLPVVEAVRRVTDLFLDTHLMIAHPERFLQAFRDAGSDSLTIHVEIQPDPGDLLRRIRELGLRCGLALNPRTPVEAVLPHVDHVDMILLMSVEPGFGGQPFLPQTLSRLEQLRRILDERSCGIPIQVDGGINAATSPQVRSAGARILVAGSAIFRSPDPAEALHVLRG